MFSDQMVLAPQPAWQSRTPWRWSAQALSNTRLALVACTLLATVGVLLVVTLQARGAQDALDEASSHTLRDYSGYAGRALGADLLRRFAEQRALILSPVIGSSGRDIRPPTVQEIARAGDASFAKVGGAPDSMLGYFRYVPSSGEIQGIGGVRDTFALRIADTMRTVAARFKAGATASILALDWRQGVYSVAFAPFYDVRGNLVAIYGFTYTRSAVVAKVAGRVFREVPLLPVSFAGSRWNYDTTRVRAGEVANDSLLAMRVRDRRGRELWGTRDAARVFASSPYGSRAVLSTNAGGVVVEAALRPGAEPLLVSTIARRAQRWALSGSIALAILLVMVSLIALRGERQGTQARRVEAMQQLALGLRHEINNALASVLLNAELLHEDRAMSSEQRERLDAIVEQAERMRKVVRRLENSDKLDVLVPYLNEGLMVDLSPTRERELPDRKFRTPQFG